MKKSFVSLLGLFLLVVCFINAGSSGAAEFEPMTIKIGHPNSSNEIDGVAVDLVQYACLILKDYVSEKTNGAVEIQVFGDAALGYEPEMIEGFKLGTMDMGCITNTVVSSMVPIATFCDLPFIFDSYEEANAYLDLDGAYMKAANAQCQDLMGATMLGYSTTGFRHLFSNTKPLNAVADLSGVKIRVSQSPLFVDMYNTLGANPTPIGWDECFTAMQQGIVDALDTTANSLYSSQIYTVTKYAAMTYHVYNSNVFLADNELWAEMHPELKQIIQDGIKVAITKTREHNLKYEEEVVLPGYEEAGVIVSRNIDTASFKEAVRPVWSDYRERVIGPEVFDASMADLEELRAAMKK